MWEQIRQQDRDYTVRRNHISDEFDPTTNNNDGGGDSDSDDEIDEEDEDVNGEIGENDEMDYDSDVEDIGTPESLNNCVMHKYLNAIQDRIQVESNTKKQMHEIEKWLFSFLENNDYWIKKEAASTICKALDIEEELPGYYRDLRVWLPDLQYKIIPPCPGCNSNCHVGIHGYSKKTLARRVIGLKAYYYIMSRRYICHSCEKSKINKYTFRAYNETSIKNLPRQYGLHFPAMLTHKLAIDKDVLDLMRPTFDAGMRPRRFRSMINEMHHKEYFRLAVLHSFSDQGKAFQTEHDKQLFSGFYDKEKYNSFVPSDAWFRRCHSKNMESICEHQDNETKKNGADIIYLDDSHKAPGKIRRVVGQKIVSGLTTIFNENSQNRSQGWNVTGGHDQLRPQLVAMKETFERLGHKGPRYAYVDNPSQSQFLLDIFPSLRETQAMLEKHSLSLQEERTAETMAGNEQIDSDQTNAENCDTTSGTDLPIFDDWFNSHCTYLNNSQTIEESAAAIMQLLDIDDNGALKYIVLGLDLEWNVPVNSRGNVIGRGKRTGLIQIAYEQDDGEIEAVLYQVHHLKKLPLSVVGLLEHQKTKFAGCQVGGDIAKLVRDFNIRMNNDKAINLAGMAVSRGFDLNGRGLDSVSQSVLDKSVPKDLQLSNWDRTNLPLAEQKYAAKDVYYSLLIHKRLTQMPDLTAPLMPSQVTPGLRVDIATYLATSSIYDKGSCAGTGTIVASSQTWIPPSTLDSSLPIKQGIKAGFFLVSIDKVNSPALKIRDIYLSGTRKFATLGDIGALPARIMIPVEMLRQHVPNRDKQIATTTAKVISHSGHIVTAPPEEIMNILDGENEDDDDNEDDNDNENEATNNENAGNNNDCKNELELNLLD